MTQNLVATHLDDAQWRTVDTAIDTLEEGLAPMLVSLSTLQRRRLVKMGESSEPFCVRTYTVMQDNAELMPRALDMDEIGRDLKSHEALWARQARIAKLLERIVDTDIALGSDVMVSVLEGYAALKRFGRASGLHALRRGLGKRFEGQGARRPTGESATPA